VARLACLLGIAFLLAAATVLAAPITQQANTKTYALTLVVGPLEMMYTPAQVKAMHPKSGEVMLGSSTGGSGMSMGSGNRHLEVHIHSRATGKVVTSATPTIGIRDESAMSSMKMLAAVPVVMMQGIGAGTADLHYGNNVKLTPGHRYQVVVTVDRQTGSFTFRA
jgi:hypothetical protein